MAFFRDLTARGLTGVRLVGAVLAEQHDEWTEGHRYLGLELLKACRVTVLNSDDPDQTEVRSAALSA